MQIQSVHEQIRFIASKTPQNTAIEMGNRRVSYKELEGKANQIANFLHGKIAELKNIPVILKNGIELVESILGVMQAGCVFVPLDPEFPENRLKMMITEIDADWLITRPEYLAKLNGLMQGSNRKINALVLAGADPQPCCNGANASEISADAVKGGSCAVGTPNGGEAGTQLNNTGSAYSFENINVYPFDPALPTDCQVPAEAANKQAYIYFTSGSTGKPKAILGRHRSLKHFIDWEIMEFGIDEATRVSQLISPSFDPFLRDVFVPLCAGGTLCIPESHDIVLYPERLRDWIDASKVNLIHSVPTIFKALMAEIEEGNCFTELKYILLAGEMLRGNDVRKFFNIFPDGRIQLVNMYGPTETTLAKMFYRVQPADMDRVSIPVGKPIPGAQVMLFDEEMRPSVQGTVGHIHIRTPFITSGYYNDRELTKKVFIQNPLGDNPQDLIYKTGDLGRMLASGDLEIIGRVDFQVKIRGVRIELGEIENQLLQISGVKEAVVVAREDNTGNKFLCAYVMGETELATNELKDHLTRELPDVMVPAYFMQLEKMPLTPNGKIDRNALPEPDLTKTVEYVAPRTRVEEVLVKIWSDVLKVEGIGIKHNFFDLGGHSLKAVSILTKLQREMDVDLPLKEIFLHPTIEELATRIETTDGYVYASIARAEAKENYAISSAQRRVYVLNQLERGSTYNMPRILMVTGKLDRARLENSVNTLIRRHETLRTSFHVVAGEVVQRIHPEMNFQIDYSEATEAELPAVIKQFFQPFNLEKAPLIRVGVVQLAPEQALLLFDTHHIVSDGSSMDILVRDFIGLYEGRDLPELPIQYKDFSEWQNTLFTSGEIEAQEQFWLKTFEGTIPVLDLPYDFPRPAVQSFEGDRLRFLADELLTRKLNDLAKANSTTLYMVLMSAFNVLLAKYSGQEDIVVGSPIAGRAHPDLENIIGMFINTLPMRNYPRFDRTFKGFLREVKGNALKAYENQGYQFEQLVSKLNVERDLSRNPLFDVLFNLHNYEHVELAIEGLNFQLYPMPTAMSKFDITLSAEEGNGQIGFIFEYCTRLFKRQTMERMGQHYLSILRQVVENAEIKLADIEMMLPEEAERLLVEFNQTAVDYPRQKTIHQLFEEQVARTPDNVALIYGEEQLTYRQFNAKANQLARMLRERGVKPDTVVAIMVERSLDMLIGIYAILKAGAAYLPLDPNYPIDRVRYALDDSGAQLILTQRRLIAEGGLVVSIETIVMDELELKGDESNLAPVTSAENLAYIIYTSGSTGKPKGVMVEHRAVLNFITGITEKIEFAPGKSILALTTVTFDIFGLETLLPLTRGLQVVIATDEHQRDTRALNICITRNNVQMLQMTPSRMRMLLNDDQSVTCLKNIETIMIGGEALPPALLEEVRAVTNARIYNMYGPTETTIWSTVKDLTGLNEVTIGRPIANTAIYILGPGNVLQPIGVPGELCIAGEGLARGYWKRPELTEERFVANPFYALTDQQMNEAAATLEETAAKQSEVAGQVSESPQATVHAIQSSKANLAQQTGHTASGIAAGQLSHLQVNDVPLSPRMYRTGDRARWLPNGEIECLGRNDDQLKIRGFRIEPGEIENQLLRHESVTEAVVIARSDNSGNKYLCAYLVGEGELSVQDLKLHLGKELPDYMIPTYFIQLEAMPTTPNGKIDKKTLPEPSAGIVSKVEYAPPTTEIEEKLIKIWEEVLAIEGIGIHHNFFEIGGNSINIMKVLSLISKRMGITVPMGELFMRPTIAELANNMFIANPMEGFDCLIRLNKYTEGKKNVFILHTWEGIVYQYKEIARQLEGEYNVFGVQAKGVSKPAKLPETLEEMITDYIVEMKAIQPEGPYTIVGYCYGNWIAYKMVEMLEDENVPIDRLIEIDENAWIRDKQRRIYQLETIVSAPYRFLRKWVRKLITRRNMNPMDIYPTLEEYRKMKPPVEGEIKNNRTVRENVNFLCTAGFWLKHFISANVYVIKAEENNLVRYTPEDWQKQTSGKVWFVEIPGGHETIFNYPYVDELVRMLRRALEE